MESEAYNKACASMRRQITTLWNLVTSSVSSHIPDLETRTTKLEVKFDEFYRRFVDEISTDAEYVKLEEIEEYFYRTKEVSQGKYKPVIMSKLQVEAPPKRVNLPRIDLPSFSGDFTKWMAYIDMFRSLIDKDSSLSDVQKLHYLKLSLKGQALQLVESLQAVEGNYPIALQILTDRYENKRLLVENLVKNLFDIPQVENNCAISLRKCTDDFVRSLRSLENIKEPTADTLLMFLLNAKLDSITKEKWQEVRLNLPSPNLNDFLKFLSNRCQVLETNVQPSKKISKHISKHVSKTSAYSASLGLPKCKCGKNHKIFQCDSFLKLSPRERFRYIRDLKLCCVCLVEKHSSKFCSASSCEHCHKPHHTLLCFNSNDATTSNFVTNSSPEIPNVETEATTSCTSVKSTNQYSLLSTALVIVHDNFDNPHVCRALLDNGSQSNFMCKSLARKLQLATTNINLQVTGIGNATGRVITQTLSKVSSKYRKFNCTLTFGILDKITGHLPSVSLNSKDFSDLPNELQLADPTCLTPGPIDLLLGVDIFYEILCQNRIKLNNGVNVLETLFGWILAGPILTVPNTNSQCFLSIDEQLTKFWEIEEVNCPKIMSQENKKCEDHYVKNTKVHDNKFVVRLPFKDEPLLGDSYHSALRQFNSLEKRLNSNANFKLEYSKFMEEYIQLGHMSLSDPGSGYFLPHHGVIKESSTTTKLRVVFNGSCKSTNGLSLNDLLMVGPVVQSELFDILLRFRLHIYALTADVEKMYRQVWVHPEDRKYQKILWRSNPNDELQIYELNTVTYGTTSAPYLATRSLQEAIKDQASSYPDAFHAAYNNFYVDDLLTGTNNEESLKKLQQDISCMLQTRGFHLRKWRSNCCSIQDEPQSLDISSMISSSSSTECSKTLGMLWNTTSDTFTYISSTAPVNPTKRTVLSCISKVYDPLGILSPIVISGKVLMQRLWQERIDWDAEVSSESKTIWTEYVKELSTISCIKINRCVFRECTYVELHGFCDASTSAYGACIYVRCIDANNEPISCELLTAKSRVAPLKTISVPRLELCGALLLAELMNKVKSALSVCASRIYFWSDSTITLSWIRASPHNYKTFVANRITQIQNLSNPSSWSHVRSHENPADLISRGCSTDLLASSSLWWNGPPYLQELCQLPTEDLWTQLNEEVDIPEYERKKVVSGVTIKREEHFMTRFSSFPKLKRITAYCIRFANNVRGQPQDRQVGLLTLVEVKNALTVLIRSAQSDEFREELKTLKTSNPLSKSSKLLALNPFIGHDHILRVGGRIQEAGIPYEQSHPVILPKGHHLTKLIINYEHLRLLHAGPQAVMASIRQSFWPINGRSMVKKILHQCTRCCKTKPVQLNPIMGNLPSERVSQSRPFSYTGLDFCGPFLVHENVRRGRKPTKMYVCVFICLTVKAVHLEAVNDLSTESFLATLKRFIARRGKPLQIHSDNGTNFIGARNEMAEWTKLLKNNTSQISDMLLDEAITWKCIPVRSPHFGGLWESAVKSCKHHLRRTAGNTILALDEFQTLLIQVEAVLNSRPLVQLTDDSRDLSFLTPGHFLIGSPLNAIPEPDLTNMSENRLSRWQRQQKMLQLFWKKWSIEYLSSLQERVKWKRHRSDSLVPGDLVAVKDATLPPLRWKMARIVTLHPGTDGIVRVATIRTAYNTVKIAIRQLSPLPKNDIWKAD